MTQRPSAPAAPTSRLPAAVAARIDALMLRAVADQQLPGISVAIGRRDGTILYARGYGFRNPAAHELADQNTVYNIASITKQFTAASILLLAQNHRLTIDDSLSKYLPDVPYAKTVSLRELMDHTSGIPDYYYLSGYRPNMSALDIVRLASTQPLRFRPGSAYEYSNTNYVLLGLVIEKAGSASYGDFVRRHLFDPARMRSSRALDIPGDGPDDARGYTLQDAAFAPVAASAADLGYGAGALASTAVDLLGWDAALYSGRILEGPYLKQMLFARPYRPGTTVRYGFGLHERRISGNRELYHRGRNDGYAGINADFPDDGIAIAMLANSEHFAPMLLVDELFALVAPARKNRATGSADEVASPDPSVDLRAKLWLQRLASGDIDRAQLSAAAERRYSPASVALLSSRLTGFGPLLKLTPMEKDSRYFGWDYTYRAAFKNAIVEYRFGVDRDGKIWNIVFDRED